MFDGKLYYVLLDLCWIYALLRGGVPERLGAAIVAIGSAITVAAMSSRAGRFGSVEVGAFIVDVLCLIAFLALALRANRYWPLWIVALQIIGTAAHAVKLADPALIGRAYAFALAFWSYPMLLLIALGTWRHQRRLAEFGVDRSWSSSSGRSEPTTGPTI